jgi:hypothetical protein
VRQLLHIRPGTIVVVDQLAAESDQGLPTISWLMQLPVSPTVRDGCVTASNDRSWIRVRPLRTPLNEPQIHRTPVETHRVRYVYGGERSTTMVHVIEVGDGRPPDTRKKADVQIVADAVTVTIGDHAYRFARRSPFVVETR